MAIETVTEQSCIECAPFTTFMALALANLF